MWLALNHDVGHLPYVMCSCRALVLLFGDVGEHFIVMVVWWNDQISIGEIDADCCPDGLVDSRGKSLDHETELVRVVGVLRLNSLYSVRFTPLFFGREREFHSAGNRRMHVI